MKKQQGEKHPSERFLVCFSGKYSEDTYHLRTGQSVLVHTVDGLRQFGDAKVPVDTVLQALICTSETTPPTLLSDLRREREVKKIVLRRVRDALPQKGIEENTVTKTGVAGEGREEKHHERQE